MAKSTQVMKVKCCGAWYTVVYKHTEVFNRFWLYEHHWAYDKYLRRYESKTIVDKYANMQSVMCFLSRDPDFRKEEI